MTRRPALVGLLLLLPFFGIAQEIRNVDVRLERDNVIITFDLSPKESVKERFDIEIYSSRDNYQTPVKVSEGNTKDVRPGNALQYIINAKEHFTGYQGELDFDVRATLTFSPVTFIEPYQDMTYKKGDFVRVAWRGGFTNDNYAISLYKGDNKVSYINSIVKTNDYLWNMPKGTKAGKYHFQLESNSSKELTAKSYEFVIKRKIPIAIKILPIVAAGVGVYFLTSGGGSESGGATYALPNPPDPPGN